MSTNFTLPPYRSADGADVDHAVWDDARRRYFEHNLQPALEACFAQHAWVASAAICVAQYWDDEADDAVHAEVVFSVLDTPDLDGAFSEGYDPNLPDFGGRYDLGSHWDILMRRGDGTLRWAWTDSGPDRWVWHDNGLTIPLFAAYCRGVGDQCAPMSDNYAPWAVVRRGANGSLVLDVVGTRHRPWLDGVQPSWDRPFDDEDDLEGEGDVADEVGVSS